MIPVKQIDPDDLPLYAMKLLPPEEMAELTENLQYSIEARKVLAEIYGELSLLAQTAEREEPKPEARMRFMNQVAREKKVIPIDIAAIEAAARAKVQPEIVTVTVEVEVPAKKTLAGKVLPWVGWAAAAMIAVEAGHEFQIRQGAEQSVAAYRSDLAATKESASLSNAALETMKDPAAQHVMLVSAETKPAPQGRVSYAADKGSLVFLASNMGPVDEGKAYELWLIPANGQAPVPAGTFRPDQRGNGSVIMPTMPKGLVAKAFGVTIENEAGSLVPTSPILMKGAAG
ncbi:anti-sigma factor domain-containing protein [Granulicella tundricola]|uniref:Anti-sigma K factor RskA n=1 Tax=Granulicella tundricola (strain ATCC BAA-1859 / DSM 23138 / MP5ACTX9) TaxID=1198114 RepID=E8X4J5_GRATM|nr:anti-sigma factor [Granulicella tundricola]ADW69405.1 Anti-sigma K factor RskA [Granulicella tundricola MP5ACTX9]